MIISYRGRLVALGPLLLKLSFECTMRSLLLLSALSVDPNVPLFGTAPYPYGEGAVPRPKTPCTSFGIGGPDSLCPDCFKEPSKGKWYRYDDPTWDFSADEPKNKAA